MAADTIFPRQPSCLRRLDYTNYGVVVPVVVLSVVVAVVVVVVVVAVLDASGVVVAVEVASGVVVLVVVLVVDEVSVEPLQADREATSTRLAAAKAIFL
ncbi:MAG: hypothetical protein IT343_06960 [Candidatus Melainabacteria bacterium]|nr:hypothetical protein [Candidatus Melainabacteria bacterium]